MKRFFIFFLYVFLISTCFGETYNYYQRNELSGIYEIRNIKNLPESYRFNYSMQDGKIIGYYYDSSSVKFIDEINDKKVTKSTYFSKETGKIIYEKTFIYGNDEEIESFIYRQINEYDEVIYEATSFFIKENGTDCRIVYKSNGFMKNGNIEQRLNIEGILSEDFKPIGYKLYGVLSDIKSKKSQNFNTEEVFLYDTYSVTSKLFQNGILYKTKKKYLENENKKYEEIIFNRDGNEISSKLCILTDSVLIQTMKTSAEVENKYDYREIDDHCYMLSYTDWDNTPVTKIETFDEVVYKKNKLTEHLKYPINLFDFSIF